MQSSPGNNPLILCFQGIKPVVLLTAQVRSGFLQVSGVGVPAEAPKSRNKLRNWVRRCLKRMERVARDWFAGHVQQAEKPWRVDTE